MASMSLRCKGPAFPKGGQFVNVQAAQQLVAALRGGHVRGEVRQEFNLCFAARLIGGQLSVSDESTEVRWVAPRRSRSCRCTSRSACASSTSWSTGATPAIA
jgi:hypothetical protein